jgi:hypothetical protein
MSSCPYPSCQLTPGDVLADVELGEGGVAAAALELETGKPAGGGLTRTAVLPPSRSHVTEVWSLAELVERISQ